MIDDPEVNGVGGVGWNGKVRARRWDVAFAVVGRGTVVEAAPCGKEAPAPARVTLNYVPDGTTVSRWVQSRPKLDRQTTTLLLMRRRTRRWQTRTGNPRTTVAAGEAGRRGDSGSGGRPRHGACAAGAGPGTSAEFPRRTVGGRTSGRPPPAASQTRDCGTTRAGLPGGAGTG